MSKFYSENMLLLMYLVVIFNSYKNTMDLILTSLLGYNKIILKTNPTEIVWIRFRIEGDNK